MRIKVYMPGPDGPDFAVSGVWTPRAHVDGLADLDEVAGVIVLSEPADVLGERCEAGTPVLVTRGALVVESETRRVLAYPRRWVLSGHWATLVRPTRIEVR